MTSLGCSLVGWGAALPPTLVKNTDLESLFETSSDWIVERSGIRTRHVATGPFVSPTRTPTASESGTTATLALESARRACDSAGLSPSEISLLILCTTTPDQSVPATSAAVAGALGISGGAMDLNAACAGFTYGLVTAAALISAGTGRVLVIGAETLTRITELGDRTNAFLFGDGAGAIVLEPVKGPGSLLGWNLGVDGSLVELLYANHGSGIVMRGKEVFRQAVQRQQIRQEPPWTMLVSIHPRSRYSCRIKPIGGLCTLRLSVSTFPWTGLRLLSTGQETRALLSIPLALVDAAEQGRLHQGDLVLLAGFGAGMTWSSAVWRWGRREM